MAPATGRLAFDSGFMVSQAIPLRGHKEKRLTFMGVMRLARKAATLVGTLAVFFRTRHGVERYQRHRDSQTQKRAPNLPAYRQSESGPASAWPHQDRKHSQISRD